jgi:threonine dehydrogenase-like Zn-dependent dehydrogenase
LSILIAAKIAGASKIIGVDVRDKPLELAREFGADHLIDARKEKNLQEKVREITNKVGVEIALEASGVPSVVKSALDLVKPFGTYVQVAIMEKPVEIDLRYVTSLEKRILGTLNPSSTVDIKKAIDVVKTHNVDLQKLLTHEFLLAEAKKAFETADKKTDDPLKIGIRIRK